MLSMRLIIIRERMNTSRVAQDMGGSATPETFEALSLSFSKAFPCAGASRPAFCIDKDIKSVDQYNDLAL